MVVSIKEWNNTNEWQIDGGVGYANLLTHLDKPQWRLD